MQPQSSLTHTVSPQLLARADFRAASRERDFGEVFRLMAKYDGVSQDKMPSPTDLTVTHNAPTAVLRPSSGELIDYQYCSKGCPKPSPCLSRPTMRRSSRRPGSSTTSSSSAPNSI
jgi:hypothetical protein